MENGGEGGGGRSRRQVPGGEANALAGLTLGAVLSNKQTLSNRIHERSLIDLIRDDPTCGKESKKTWKTFRDKLRLKRAGAAWTSSVPIPASDVPIHTNNNRIMMMRRSSGRYPTENPADETGTEWQLSSSSRSMRRNASRLPERQSSRLLPVETDPPEEEHLPTPAEEGGDTPGEGVSGDGGEKPAVRMSLMALLADDGSAYMDDEEEEEEEEDEGGADETEEECSGEYNDCCVCMVRHKGAAFIPCGHTFCRLCSRELYVQRGNCPICNNFILEILDIF